MKQSTIKYAISIVFVLLWISKTSDSRSIIANNFSAGVGCTTIDGLWFSSLGAKLYLPTVESANTTTSTAATLSANNDTISLIGVMKYDNNSSNTTFTIVWRTTNDSICSRILTGECVTDENAEILTARLVSTPLSSTRQEEQRNRETNQCDSILETLLNVKAAGDKQQLNFTRHQKNPLTAKNFFGGGDEKENSVSTFFKDPFGLGSWWNSLLGSLSATVVIALIIIIMCLCCPICITVRSWCKAIRHCECCPCRCCRDRERQFDVVDARYRRDMKPLKGKYKKYRK